MNSSIGVLPAGGEMLRELKGHGSSVFSAAFSAEGARIVTGSHDQTARVWDAAGVSSPRRTTDPRGCGM